ncbi:TIGR02391 family protein [Reichenbachiella sp.]|uniref:TIGR02391 family protein n=1 Tax=Reichenbachiella sp. TaxID=2184521 RepID=UPI0032998F4E
MPEESLILSFEPNTIEHLGVKMYSHIPPALAELIANSYDACAHNVSVKLYDGDNRRVIVEDDGIGMTFDEINEYFLRIGRNRRKENQESSCDRVPTGKKGLGKLALFGIGDRITIITKKNREEVKFVLDWNQIINWDDKNYTPSFDREALEENVTGTTIILEELKRVSDFSIEDYSISIAKLFNFSDENFKVFLSHNDGDPILIDNKLKYQSIEPEFSWDFKEVIELVVTDYSNKNEVVGQIYTTEKPLKPGLRGVTLFANGRMINAPEFFGRSDSSHFFSYATGWLDVDFIDNVDDDLISTDRQSISWEHELTAPLRVFLSECLRVLEGDWRNKRKEKRRENVQTKTKININTWLKTIPSEILEKLEPIINRVDSSELTSEEQSETIENLHSLIPEYPKYHWRHLNEKIKNVSKDDYERADYLRAAEEAIKNYENEVKIKSELTSDFGSALMGRSFGKNNEPLKITDNISETDKNIEEGQKHMSMGVMSGFRNPSMHENKDTVYPAIFDDNDCLDLLSMMSYLFNKLEKARNINKT